MERIKTAILYDPYLDTLGGGERYTLTIAEVLLSQGWQVDLAWKDQKTLEKAKQRFGLKLDNLNISAEYFNLFSKRASLVMRYQSLKNIDLVFIVSDGSVPILFGKKTFLHYQVPFTTSNRNRLINRIKLLTIDKVIVNSKFTKKVIDHTFMTNKSYVIYPPVDVASFKSGRKTKTILNVGRFFSPSHSKRQDVLIEAFKELVDDGLKDWELVLAGATFGNDDTLKSLQSQAKSYPIKFAVNPSFQELQKYYESASIYWHAAGYGVDEKNHPEGVEHFGITTVEAMSAGAVPVVHNKGGQKESVDVKTGFLWDTTGELKNQTLKLIKEPKLLKKLEKNAQAKSTEYSNQEFARSFLTLLK